MVHISRRTALSTASAAALAGAVLVTQQVGSASAQPAAVTAKTIALTTKTEQSFRNDVGPNGDSAGDTRTVSEYVFLAGKRVGRASGQCIDSYFVDKADVNGRLWAMCTETIMLPGGQIVGQGMLVSSKPAKPILLAITGGTGTYAGARGTMSLDASGSATTLTVRLL